MKKIKIVTTSFLNQTSLYWKQLSSHYTMAWGEYNSWFTDLANPKVHCANLDAVVAVTFLRDVLNSSTLLKLDETTDKDLYIKETVNAFLKPLEIYVSKSTTPLFVLYSLNCNTTVSPIWDAKKETVEYKFKKEFETQLNQLRNNDCLYTINLDNYFAVEGIKSVFDSRLFYSAKCHLSKTGTKILVDTISSVLKRLFSSRKKVLVLDCDNTIWGGVIGEDGIQNIKIGQDGQGKIFSDFQYVAKVLLKRGVILAISSKNNHKDVMTVFETHPSMVLKASDISNFKINWEDKHKNILQISKELNVGLDSLVFWDDNPLEREMVRNFLPEVETVEPPADISQWPDYLCSLDSFADFILTAEDLKKADQYKIREKFLKEVTNTDVSDQLTLLRSFEMKISQLAINNEILDRAHQLCIKTNQFNLRTVRHTKETLSEISKSKNYIHFMVSLDDKFGSHGIIALVIVKIDEQHKVAFLDTLLMSCRVLGRSLESYLFTNIIEKLSSLNIKHLVAERIPTEKNVLVEDLLNNMGFSEITKNDFKNEDIEKHGFTYDLCQVVEVSPKTHFPNQEVFFNESN